MDNERRGARSTEPRILWGRIAVYTLTLLAVFALGWWLGGRGEASEDELASYRVEVNELRRDNYELEQQVAALAAGQMDPPGQDDPPPAEGVDAVEGEGAPVEGADAEDSPDDAAPEPEAPEPETPEPTEEELPPGARTYEVQAGDTLTSIAQEVYGDGSKFELIAAANGVDGQLVIGQELIIPAEQ